MVNGKMIVVAVALAIVVACGSGGSSSSGSGASTVECKQSGADGSDKDCVGQNLPRKFDCTTAAQQQGALNAGCAKEDPADPTDYDVCCPSTVTGSSSSSSSSGGPTSVTGCEQKAGADTDAECAGMTGKPRKLDCDATATNNAVTAGCAKISASGSDVCCPTTVTGAGK